MEKIRELLTHKNKKTRSMQMTISISFTILSVSSWSYALSAVYQKSRESYSRKFKAAS